MSRIVGVWAGGRLTCIVSCKGLKSRCFDDRCFAMHAFLTHNSELCSIECAGVRLLVSLWELVRDHPSMLTRMMDKRLFGDLHSVLSTQIDQISELKYSSARKKRNLGRLVIAVSSQTRSTVEGHVPESGLEATQHAEPSTARLVVRWNHRTSPAFDRRCHHG
jgi:hypothetical protein